MATLPWLLISSLGRIESCEAPWALSHSLPFPTSPPAHSSPTTMADSLFLGIYQVWPHFRAFACTAVFTWRALSPEICKALSPSAGLCFYVFSQRDLLWPPSSTLRLPPQHLYLSLYSFFPVAFITTWHSVHFTYSTPRSRVVSST